VSRLLTAVEVADRLRVSPREVQRLAAAGRLPGAFRVGRLWRFSEERLLEGLMAASMDRGGVR
jgi:excisionase family DNA binding protein